MAGEGKPAGTAESISVIIISGAPFIFHWIFINYLLISITDITTEDFFTSIT